MHGLGVVALHGTGACPAIPFKHLFRVQGFGHLFEAALWSHIVLAVLKLQILEELFIIGAGLFLVLYFSGLLTLAWMHTLLFFEIDKLGPDNFLLLLH